MDFDTAEDDRSNVLALAQQRHTQNSEMVLLARYLLCLRKIIPFSGEHVLHMHRFFIDDRASCGPVTADEPFVAIYRYWPVMRTKLKLVTSLETYYGVICLAKLASSFNNGLEDWSHIGRRRCDHPEEVLPPGLISQCLG